MRERSRAWTVYIELWLPDSSSEASYRDITFLTLRLGGGRVRKILSTEPTAGFIVEAPTMRGPFTENISLARHTFDSTGLRLAESSHDQTGRKSEEHYIDNWSMRERSLTVTPGGQSSTSVDSSTISRGGVSSRRSWVQPGGL